MIREVPSSIAAASPLNTVCSLCEPKRKQEHATSLLLFYSTATAPILQFLSDPFVNTAMSFSVAISYVQSRAHDFHGSWLGLIT